MIKIDLLSYIARILPKKPKNFLFTNTIISFFSSEKFHSKSPMKELISVYLCAFRVVSVFRIAFKTLSLGLLNFLFMLFFITEGFSALAFGSDPFDPRLEEIIYFCGKKDNIHRKIEQDHKQNK